MNVRKDTLFIFLLVLFFTAGAARISESNNECDVPHSIEPSEYVIMELDGRLLVEPSREGYKVIPKDGVLKLSFDTEKMKHDWDLDTGVSISIIGYINNRTKGKRNIEIPNYSVVAEKLTVYDLDIAAANQLIDQILQGSRFGHRVKEASAEASRIISKKRIDVMDEILEAQENLLVRTEDILQNIYIKSSRLELVHSDLEEISKTWLRAQQELEQKQAAFKSLSKAEVNLFFSGLVDENVTLHAWLKQLIAPENERYLKIFAQAVERDPLIIKAAATETEQLMARIVKGDVKEEDLERYKALLEKRAEHLKELEENVIRYYHHPPAEFAKRLTNSRQYKCYNPSIDDNLVGVQFKDLKLLPFELDTVKHAQCVGKCKAADAKSDTNSLARRLSLRRLETLEKLRMDIVETHRYRRMSDLARKRFERELDEMKSAHQDLIQRREKESARHTSLCEAACAESQRVIWNHERSKLITAAVRLYMIVGLIDSLIKDIPTAAINLSSLSLEEGDELVISVSFVPRRTPDTLPDEQSPIGFTVVPWGFSGPLPKIRDFNTFVRAEEGNSETNNFQPSPGVAALWNWYGKGRDRKTVLRAIAPGIGIHSSFLNFNEEADTLEFGIGPVFTLFDNLVGVTLGWNLQETSGPKGKESRRYYGIGFSISKIAEKFFGSKESE